MASLSTVNAPILKCRGLKFSQDGSVIYSLLSSDSLKSDNKLASISSSSMVTTSIVSYRVDDRDISIIDNVVPLFIEVDKENIIDGKRDSEIQDKSLNNILNQLTNLHAILMVLFIYTNFEYLLINVFILCTEKI